MENNILTIALYVLLISLLLGTLWFIQKKRKQARSESLSVVSFNKKIQAILLKLETPKEKIDALKYALEKIESNDDYDRNLAWKNGLLITIYLHMIVAYNDMSDDDKILEVSDKILNLNAKHALTYYNRGQIYYRKKDYDKALSDLRKYLELDKKDKWGVRQAASELIKNIE